MEKHFAFMRFINTTSRCSLRYREAFFKEEGLKGIHINEILSICNTPAMSQENLAQKLHLNKSNVARQISLLEEKGYVYRQVDEKDKRILRVYPTQKAFLILPKIKEVLHSFHDILLEELTVEEAETLTLLLERIQNKAENVLLSMEENAK